MKVNTKNLSKNMDVTTDLIARSLQAVDNGSKIASDTANALLTAAQGAGEVSTIIDKISQASSEQATAIAQVNQGVDLISSVVQTDSATAEESAAASEELSSQAAMLKTSVGQFILKSDSAEYV